MDLKKSNAIHRANIIRRKFIQITRTNIIQKI